MVYALVSLFVLAGSIAAWALIGVGARGVYRHADSKMQRLMRWQVRVVFPLAGLAVAVAIAIALTLKHYLHPSSGGFFAIWMLSFAGCFIPVFIYMAIHVSRHRTDPEG